MSEYDAIAGEYQESKRLSFREHVERYTLFETLGDVRGKTVLDLACGEGFYTRLLRQAGASEVTGVDISAAMIELAEEGMTMLCGTHEMGFARKVANRVIFMDAGQIVEQNEPEEFFNNPQSDRTKLFLSQILGH